MNKILQHAVSAAEEAGKIILNFYHSEFIVNHKGFGNPVTEADLEADACLKQFLTEKYPDYGWLSEETRDSADRLTKDRVWVVDPLDGTKEFVEGVPNFAVSIGLAEHGEPILGVIHNPVSKDTYTAAKGLGMHFNGTPTSICKESNLKKMNILNSRSETRRGLWQPYMDHFKELIPIGSIALKLAMTAANQADMAGSLKPKNEWDICAGHCMINESGGKMVTTENLEITYNKPNTLMTPGLVAGNEQAVNHFLNLL